MFSFKFSIITLLISIAFLFTSAFPDSFKFYVSKAGSDSNQGNTPGEPFAGLQRAFKAAADNNRAELTDTTTIFIDSGTYYLTQPLVINQCKNDQLFIKPLDNCKVVISGGKEITGWKKYSDKIWVTRIPEVISKGWRFRQLFVDGQLRQRAKTPNSGFFRVKGLPDGGLKKGYRNKSIRFFFRPGDIDPAWSNFEDAEITFFHFWTDSHLKIKQIDADKSTVILKYPSRKVFTDDYTNNKARYIVENIFEELDSPGEWYLDRQTGSLYYFKPDNEDLNTSRVISPVVPELMKLEGKGSCEFVENVHFFNIDFMYNNFDLPEGNVNDKQASSSIPGAITLTFAKNCSFDSCTIANTGTYGLEISDGCSNITIKNCTFRDLAAGGIRINGGDAKSSKASRTGFINVEGNEIHSYGRVFPSAAGILLMNAHDNKISHNKIHHGFYSGIIAGWVWDYEPSVSRNNIIEFNHVHDIGQGMLSDMGGIYTLGNSPGTVIRNNVIHDIDVNSYGGFGIYNDQGSSNILIENNIVYNTRSGGYYLHFGSDIELRNNIFALGKDAQISIKINDKFKKLTFKNNINYWNTGRVFSGNLVSGRIYQQFAEIDSNLYFNPGLERDKIRIGNMNWDKWKKTGKDRNSIFGDPMFHNPQEQDFSIDSLSPALKIGFKPINQ